MLSFVPTREEFEQASGKSKMPSMMGHGNTANKMFESKLESILYEDEQYSPEKELTYESLIEFGKVYFTPSNMIISVVSPALPVEIEKYFYEFKDEISAPNNELGFIKKFKNISEPIKVEIEGGGEQSYLYYGFQKSIDENDKAALKVLSLLLSDHIVFDIREKQGLAYRMSAGIEIIEDKAMFYINMGTRPENVETIIPQFPGFFTKNFTNNVTESAVKRSVNMYLGRMMFRRLSSINQAYYLGHSKYFYNDVNHDSKILEAIKTVTAQDVVKVINKYLEIKDPVEVYVK
jgi:predicted Zn-dependent peptidase